MKHQFKDVLKDSRESKNFDMWKDELGSHLSCSRNDMKCWSNLLPKLTCQIDDTHCWKEKLPHVPCEEDDSQCWRRLMPHLPCKVEDHQCWKQIKSGYVLRDVNSHQEKIINKPAPPGGFDPTSNFQRHYGGRKAQHSNVWVI